MSIARLGKHWAHFIYQQNRILAIGLSRPTPNWVIFSSDYPSDNASISDQKNESLILSVEDQMILFITYSI